jgi:hypothetical protein
LAGEKRRGWRARAGWRVMERGRGEGHLVLGLPRHNHEGNSGQSECGSCHSLEASRLRTFWMSGGSSSKVRQAPRMPSTDDAGRPSGKPPPPPKRSFHPLFLRVKGGGGIGRARPASCASNLAQQGMGSAPEASLNPLCNAFAPTPPQTYPPAALLSCRKGQIFSP